MIELPIPDVPFAHHPQTGPTSDSALYDGPNVEGAVVVALWDLFDAVDDSNYYQGPSLYGHNNDFNSNEYWWGTTHIWEVFRHFDPQPENADVNYCRTIYDFIHGWRSQGYPLEGKFRDIFEAHNIAVFLPGDVDGNGILNVSDAIYLIGYVFGGGPEPQPVLAAGDADGNCAANVADAVYLIDHIFGNGAAPVPGCA
jgi:hypothetical protein